MNAKNSLQTITRLNSLVADGKLEPSDRTKIVLCIEKGKESLERLRFVFSKKYEEDVITLIDDVLEM